jgi:CRISPR system Cascade subunit CasE
MSWLSQVHIDKAEAARLQLRDAYTWHQRLWQSFTGRDERERSFLFRIDDRHNLFRVLLLSPEAPAEQSWGTWQSKEIAASFLQHDYYLFQVRANPTVKRVTRGDGGERKKNGRRTGIYDADGLRCWIERKATQSGFELLSFASDPPIPYFFVKKGHRGKHIAVDFKGTLRVTNRQEFERAFFTGIGPAKSFGFGLLMLQPAAQTSS